MSQPFEERAYQNMRGRHMVKVRALAESIQAHAGHLIADLDGGRMPYLRSLDDDARELARRLDILEAIGELKGMYDSGAEAGR